MPWYGIQKESFLQKRTIRIKVFHEDILCQGIFFEWLETLTYLMTKTLQCLSAHESPSDEAK